MWLLNFYCITVETVLEKYKNRRHWCTFFIGLPLKVKHYWCGGQEVHQNIQELAQLLVVLTDQVAQLLIFPRFLGSPSPFSGGQRRYKEITQERASLHFENGTNICWLVRQVNRQETTGINRLTSSPSVMRAGSEPAAATEPAAASPTFAPPTSPFLWRGSCFISCVRQLLLSNLTLIELRSVETCQRLMGVSFTIQACSYSFLLPGSMWAGAPHICLQPQGQSSATHHPPFHPRVLSVQTLIKHWADTHFGNEIHIL